MAVAVQVRKLRSTEELRAHLEGLGVELPFDQEIEAGGSSPLAQPLEVSGRRVGNRFCILPMEGWDATRDGRPTDLVARRWERFGRSGAKLIWGGEAVAVRHDGRANPNQLRIGPDTVGALADLRGRLVAAHEDQHGTSDDLLVGLQLTHSGRWSRPDGDPAPRVAYRHPLLDARLGIQDDAAVLDTGELEDLVACFGEAAALAQQAGFSFVDLKACHGYLGHELLSAVDRTDRYGGELEGRTTFLREAIGAVRAAAPGLLVGARVSVFDLVPFRADEEGVGRPEDPGGTYRLAFGGDGTGLGVDLAEPFALVDRLGELGVELVCTTAGSPYYNPHIQRPAYFPPSDGYTPPEDPLRGVARQIEATRDLKRHRPATVLVGSGYSYLQEWLPHVAQAVVRAGWVDAVGLGRMALSYPDLPTDVLAGRPLERRRLCRTFSDCTTAPRNGVVSGCYPLDEHYKAMPERATVASAKKAMRAGPARS